MTNEILNTVLKSLPETYRGMTPTEVIEQFNLQHIEDATDEVKDKLLADGYTRHEPFDVDGEDKNGQGVSIRNGQGYVITEEGKAFIESGGYKTETAFAENNIEKTSVADGVKTTVKKAKK